MKCSLESISATLTKFELHHFFLLVLFFLVMEDIGKE